MVSDTRPKRLERTNQKIWGRAFPARAEETQPAWGRTGTQNQIRSTSRQDCVGSCKPCRECGLSLKGSEFCGVIYILKSCLCGEWFIEGQSRQRRRGSSEEELTWLGELNIASEEKNQPLDFWYDQHVTWMDICADCWNGEDWGRYRCRGCK